MTKTLPGDILNLHLTALVKKQTTSIVFSQGSQWIQRTPETAALRKVC